MKKVFNLIAVLGVVSQFALAQYTSYPYNNGDYDSNPNSGNKCYNLSNNLRKGDRDVNTSNQVTQLQEALNQLDYLSQDPTGYFGSLTFTAVKNFQTANNLAATGYVGPLTRSALQSRTCGNTNPVGGTCAIGVTIYSGNTCTCPSGYYAQYSSYGAFVCTISYGTPTSFNLTPSTVSSPVYDRQNDKPLQGFRFTLDNNSYNNNTSLSNVSVYLASTNISGATVTKSDCNRGLTGASYYNYNDPVTDRYCPDSTIFVAVNPSNMNDNQTYNFTIRITENNVSTDKYYSFQFKKTGTYYDNGGVCLLNTMYTNGNTCTCPIGSYKSYLQYSFTSFSCVSSIYTNPGVCAVGNNVQVDLATCSCPSGYVPVYYPTYYNDGTRPGRCDVLQYTW